nr:MAG TPA: hypothetical protein [Caudoviricetes sp.]
MRSIYIYIILECEKNSEDVPLKHVLYTEKKRHP